MALVCLAIASSLTTLKTSCKVVAKVGLSGSTGEDIARGQAHGTLIDDPTDLVKHMEQLVKRERERERERAIQIPLKKKIV
jgi:hypothetical protein